MWASMTRGLALLLPLLVAAPLVAATMPDVLVEETINELIDQLETRRAELEQDKQKLFDMVEEVVVPHFEVPVIAQLVLAKHWRQASDPQRVAFSEEFKKLLVRTYATALFEYTGKEKMEVRPLRLKDGERRAKVETLVTLPGAPPVPVNYSFLLTDSGDWKIYDLNIDGISLVTNYRTSYSQYIRDKGLDALIEEMSEKNRSLTVKTS